MIQVNGILSVRPAAGVDKGIEFAAFRNGGLARERAPIQKLSGPHATAAATTEALARMLDPHSIFEQRLADGKFATHNGQTYAIDDWGNMDWKILNERVGWRT